MGAPLPVQAQQLDDGFIVEAGPEMAMDSGSVARTRPVRLHQGELRSGRKATLELEIFEGTELTAELAPRRRAARGWSHWSGKLAGDPDSSVTIVRNGSDLAAHIVSPEGTYRIRNVGGGDHVAEEIRTSAFPAEEDVVVTPPVEPGAPVVAAADVPEVAGADNVIDVMVPYTPGAASDAGGARAIRAEAALAVSATNNVYQTSGLPIRMRLLGTYALKNEITVDSTGLSQITGRTDGIADDVHRVRDLFAADLVATIARSGSYCGIAYVMNNLSAASAPWGFSVTGLSCAVGNLSFPHEIGHNLGATHDRFVSSSNSLFPYGFGYVNTTARWRTVMSYNDACSSRGFNCTRLARFSNPNASYNGAALGRPSTAADSADNVRALRASMPVVANYKTK